MAHSLCEHLEDLNKPLHNRYFPCGCFFSREICIHIKQPVVLSLLCIDSSLKLSKWSSPLVILLSLFHHHVGNDVSESAPCWEH